MKVKEAAEALVARAAARGIHGRTLGPSERQQIAAALPAYPAWLLDLLSSVPLCGLELGWEAYEPAPDFDGVLWVEVSDAAGILSESLELYPGIAILQAGYINFAGGAGSGDPYFLDARAGDDPPLYEVYHDVVSEVVDTLPDEGRKLVLPRLSKFLETAILE